MSRLDEKEMRMELERKKLLKAQEAKLASGTDAQAPSTASGNIAKVQAAQSLLSSKSGGGTSKAGGALSGGLQGAAVGASIGGGAGAAVGGAVGIAKGVLAAKKAKKEKKAQAQAQMHKRQGDIELEKAARMQSAFQSMAAQLGQSFR